MNYDDYLNPATIKSQAKRMYDLALSGQTHFIIQENKLSQTARFVLEVIKKNYPDLTIPPHGRLRHFTQEQLKHIQNPEHLIDLIVISVLLDAGAGTSWQYFDELSQKIYTRSEGLAVASFNMFYHGVFEDLSELTLEDLHNGFQIHDNNLLIGLEGRLHLLQALGKALQKDNKQRASEWFTHYPQGKLSAVTLLRTIQEKLGSIWPSRLTLENKPLGDVWRYPAFGNDYVPFHKLSQWLTYSLIEPLEMLKYRVIDLDKLTGLAEYRNGGLFLDMHVLQLRDPLLQEQTHEVDSEFIVEWRALTIHLLEQLAVILRNQLQRPLPMANILEGGTWQAGRICAQQKRNGQPPLRIVSDATVF